MIFVAIAIIMWFVLHRSIYGRHLLAVGRNELAARYSGIRTRLVVGSTYVLAGFLTGVSGVLFSFYTNSVSASNHGNFYELYGIAAAVLGGRLPLSPGAKIGVVLSGGNIDPALLASVLGAR